MRDVSLNRGAPQRIVHSRANTSRQLQSAVRYLALHIRFTSPMIGGDPRTDEHHENIGGFIGRDVRWRPDFHNFSALSDGFLG